ncbi:hypothetical protein HanRHA438_Chr02g0088621 [Helianthus annuus]|nr:hypothetical protein HanIR_Chr02g0090181 [Helianthus annuus]KAJ0778039.1 hypothetical protein HanLR1_Chr02g0067311 [Helianthus annuus]KAJ0940899.1 hypothetical protein HanRHA438_Chr02g0088621 [Helianthus annuus]
MTSFNKKKSNWVQPKGHNVQDLQTLRTKLINFKDKGQSLQFGTYIKDKTCNLLLIKCSKRHPIMALSSVGRGIDKGIDYIHFIEKKMNELVVNSSGDGGGYH